MKRFLLLGLTVASFLVPAGAHAATPCRDKIYNEWYATGKVSTTYPLACYQDALKHIPPDAQVYSNLDSDIKSAMQVATARQNGSGGGGPTSVGSSSPVTTPHRTKAASKTRTKPAAVPLHDGSNHDLAAAPLSSPSSGGFAGVPTPILVLGTIAILLALAGLVGTGVQTVRKRRAA